MSSFPPRPGPERAQRTLGPDIADFIASQPPTAHPLDTLRAVVSLLGANDPAAQDITAAAVHAKALRLFAVLPSIIAMDQRRRQGLGAIAPRNHLSYAENFLYMTFGKVPEPQITAAFEASLILNVERDLNASARPSRADTAIPDLYSDVAAAISALKGSVDGGVSKAVMQMLNEVAIPDNAELWVREAIADRREIKGFGRVGCVNGNSSVAAGRAALGMIAALRNGQDLLEVYDATATAIYQANGLHPDLDCPVSPAYHLIGFDTPTFAPILVATRLPGWTVHIAKQLSAWPRHGSSGRQALSATAEIGRR